MSSPCGCRVALIICVLAFASGCDTVAERIELPPIGDAGASAALEFSCTAEDAVACVGGTYHSCERIGEFLQENKIGCAARGLVCVPELGCTACIPELVTCDGHRVVRCLSDGMSTEQLEVCDHAGGFTCHAGGCVSMCAVAQNERSYLGCEFYAVDLDNATISQIHDAARQQYAVVVSNLQQVPVEVFVEVNQAAFGESARVEQAARTLVPPGDLEIFALPGREVDGSSREGLNDGTHTALSSNAYRIRSSHPIIAYQFNPLDNVAVFSNEASLLIPTSAIERRYTVVGWPQTIGHSEDPAEDFDFTADDEDLRAFLTVVGTESGTHLQVELGPDVGQVVGAGPIPQLGPGQALELELGPFDVVNLETQGLRSDFTGTRIIASQPVSVFVGSEASDVPIFDQYETRQCCADHLEEQLFPDATLGTYYLIARMPPRTRALNGSFIDGSSVAEVDEPEWVRLVAAAEGDTVVSTTLPPPDDLLILAEREGAILRADRDFVISSDKPLAVLQALPSQEVVGIPKELPGGDPSIIAVPPTEQYRDNYVFLTPDKYAFDFITVVAESGTHVLLDGEELPEHCTSTEVPSGGEASGRDYLVHRCQLSFPEVTRSPVTAIREGRQSDGVHSITADRPVGLIVYGFDRFVSYAYAGGLDLKLLY